MWSAATEAWLARQQRRAAPWLALFAGLLALEVSPWWSPTPDAVVYLSMARALARTGELASFGSAHTGLPPGYAVLLAPTFWLSDRPFLAIAILQWLLAVTVTLASYVWARRIAPDCAVIATGLIVLNVSFWILVRRPLSEIAFLAFLLVAASALHGLLASRAPRGLVIRGLAAAAALAAAIAVREAAVVLVPALAIAGGGAWLRGRCTRQAAVAIALTMTLALGCLVVVVGYDLITASGTERRLLGSHLDGFIDPRSPFGARLAEGLRLRIAEMGRLAVPGMFKAYGPPGAWLDATFGIEAAFAIAIWGGWIRLVRRSDDVLVRAFPFYFALHAAWGFDAGTRYMLPMLPVLVLSAWMLIAHRSDRLRLAALALAAHAVVTLGYHLSRELPRALACHRLWPSVDHLADRIRADDTVDADVASLGAPECAALMLSFLLDRPVAQDPLSVESAPWLLTRSSTDAPPGFELRGEATPLQVWKRAP